VNFVYCLGNHRKTLGDLPTTSDVDDDGCFQGNQVLRSLCYSWWETLKAMLNKIEKILLTI